MNYVNCHATSTPAGDRVEAAAIERVIGKTFVSSTKGATGHLLGAAGSVEAIFTLLAMYHGTIPHTLNLNKTDVQTEKLKFVKDEPIAWENSETGKVGMSNSFGFGGTNASLCFQEFKE